MLRSAAPDSVTEALAPYPSSAPSAEAAIGIEDARSLIASVDSSRASQTDSKLGAAELRDLLLSASWANSAAALGRGSAERLLPWSDDTSSRSATRASASAPAPTAYSRLAVAEQMELILAMARLDSSMQEEGRGGGNGGGAGHGGGRREKAGGVGAGADADAAAGGGGAARAAKVGEGSGAGSGGSQPPALLVQSKLPKRSALAGQRRSGSGSLSLLLTAAEQAEIAEIEQFISSGGEVRRTHLPRLCPSPFWRPRGRPHCPARKRLPSSHPRAPLLIRSS